LKQVLDKEVLAPLKDREGRSVTRRSAGLGMLVQAVCAADVQAVCAAKVPPVSVADWQSVRLSDVLAVSAADVQAEGAIDVQHRQLPLVLMRTLSSLLKLADKEHPHDVSS